MMDDMRMHDDEEDDSPEVRKAMALIAALRGKKPQPKRKMRPMPHEMMMPMDEKSKR